MSKTEVKARESSTVLQDDDEGLAYAVKIGQHKMLLAYFFMDDKLHRAGYVLTEKFTNKNKYVDVYEEFVASLKDKYGKPQKEETYWSDDLYKNRYNDRGMAYSTGRVTSFAECHPESTTVQVAIDGNNFEITVRLIYTSNVFDKGFEEQSKSKIKSNL